eukprot:SAG31_NODE_8526_length_1435_cov_2.202096_1_plen_22_part_10
MLHPFEPCLLILTHTILIVDGS